MDEFVAFAAKLSDVGFPTLLVIIGYGSYKRIWVWGRELVEAKAETSYWKSMAFNLAGLAETSIGIEKSTRQP